MEAKLSDPSRSAAVIVGTSEQSTGSSFYSLPAVASNVSRLSALLRNPDIWGLPQDRCTDLLNTSRDEFFTTVGNALKAATDTVVIYFAGHGMLHPSTNELYLCLPGARKQGDYNTSAIRYADLQTTLREPQYHVPRKVVILDCCYAAKAFGGMGGNDEFDAQVTTPGVSTLVSSDEMVPSKAPQGAEYTAYTTRLVSVLAGGLPKGNGLLTLQEVHEEVRERLLRARMPEPRILTSDSGPHICIARNTRATPGNVPVHLPADEEARLEFQPDLYRILAEGLGRFTKAIVGESIPWHSLGSTTPVSDGERLLAVIDQTRFLGYRRFLAFSTERVLWKAEGNKVVSVPYGLLRRMTVQVTQKAPVVEHGILVTWRDEPNGVWISSDDRVEMVPDRNLPYYPLRDLLVEIRSAAERHGITK
ncbi:caspase family protein [Streptomyces sp. NBC_01408]|uniref:caspase family protein n=1 Tax=Streptomyces sp. NBC_01408 TaxID=2903855 RepID=UPI002259C973|nr:caspase family protein [Streptomyces sp. NBC_01408]MCX4695504.1 caspase family protein [Streptomyces sp. NBC_01408]